MRSLKKNGSRMDLPKDWQIDLQTEKHSQKVIDFDWQTEKHSQKVIDFDWQRVKLNGSRMDLPRDWQIDLQMEKHSQKVIDSGLPTGWPRLKVTGSPMGRETDWLKDWQTKMVMHSPTEKAKRIRLHLGWLYILALYFQLLSRIKLWYADTTHE